MKKILFIFLLLGLPTLPVAQTPYRSQSEAMQKLDFLVGKWKGERRMLRLDDSWVTIKRTCEVKSRKNDPALRVTCTDQSSTTSVNIRIFYDESAKSYRWRREGGKEINNATLIEPRGLRLSIDEAYLTLRDVITVTDAGVWSEVMEHWNSGRGWYKAEEITLQRKQ